MNRFEENENDEKVRQMYISAPYPFVSFEHFNTFKDLFLKDLTGVVDICDLKDKRILDAGCGTGEKSCILAEFAAEVVSVDASSESLMHAKSNSQKLNIRNIKFIETSLLNIDIVSQEGLFDVVFCSGVLHHLSEPYQGFKNILKCLKPGGLIIVSLYHPLGLLGYSIRYKLIELLAGDNQEKRFNWAVKLFYRGKDINDSQLRSKIFDTYVHPQIAFFSTHYVNNKWFVPHRVSIKNIHAKYSNIRFILFGASRINTKLKLIDMWYGLRRKGFVYISGIKE